MIEVKDLCKSFKVAKRNPGVIAAFKGLIHREYSTIQALDKISFKINKGDIVGYIGPNGAGKSTTIKVMSGILVPDSGKCDIMGFTPWKNRKDFVRNIGVVFGQRSQLWWDVPVIDSFNLLKDIYKIPSSVYKDNLELLTSTLDLTDILKTPVRQLSLGQRMRCEIGASLLHDPQILFLDEPTIGLDAVSKLAVRKFIKTINQEKQVTIILTTHDMFDIEALAQRIILIGKGKILLDGSLNELKTMFGQQKIITLTYSDILQPLSPSLPIIEKTNERIKLNIDTTISSIPDIIQQISSYVNIEDIDISNRPIDDIIVELYKEYQI